MADSLGGIRGDSLASENSSTIPSLAELWPEMLEEGNATTARSFRRKENKSSQHHKNVHSYLIRYKLLVLNSPTLVLFDSGAKIAI